MAKKIRLDALLCQKGLVAGREKAKAIIMSGDVFINGVRADKPGMTVAEDSEIEVRAEPLKYVSRGGLKLEKALQEFGISVEGKIAMDVGASTGGFTDCILQNGGKKVYAVDVGYGQLAWTIRNDPRVVVMERTNIRYVTSADIKELIEFCCIDVSFISLRIVLPAIKPLLVENAEVVCLIKPQFEAGKEKVGKNGVIRDSAVHLEVIENILIVVNELGFSVKNISYSPIKGPKGNIEYLAHLVNTRGEGSSDIDAKEIVKASHEQLDA